MKVGNLVYHKEDIGGAGPVPGLIVELMPYPLGYEALVQFTDRAIAEIHEFDMLIKVAAYEYNDCR